MLTVLSTMEIAVGEEEQWGLLKARLIFGLLSPALSLCGPTRDGKETVRSQHDYSAPAAFERGDRMSQKTLLCNHILNSNSYKQNEYLGIIYFKKRNLTNSFEASVPL